MKRLKFLAILLACSLPIALLPSVAGAQCCSMFGRSGRNAQMLGVAHVDHTTGHKTIQVGHQAGNFRAIMFQVAGAPIQFEQVVVHYDNRESRTLRVPRFIAPGRSSRWIRLPGGRRYIHSVEIWFARAEPGNPTTPEVLLYGKP